MIKLNGEEIVFKRFPNGELKLEEKQIIYILKINRKQCNFEFYFRNNESLIKLMIAKKYIDDLRLGDFTSLIITYMPYSRMDRREGDSCFSLKYICDFINSLSFNMIYVNEPHSDVTPALLNNVSCIFERSKEITHRIIADIGFDKNRDILFYPDSGASKRYSSKIKAPYLTGIKKRNWNTGEIEGLDVCGKIPEKDFKVIIVDDLCSYGGTFLHSAKKLKELGAGEIYLAVTHCENSVLDGELINSGLITKIYTTNSIFTGKHHLIKVYKMSGGE